MTRLWDIRPAPTPTDPNRHVLLLKGGMPDIAALLRKFGALLGRPATCETDGFNFSLHLHKLTPQRREDVGAWLAKRFPPQPASIQIAAESSPPAERTPTAAVRLPAAGETAAPPGGPSPSPTQVQTAPGTAALPGGPPPAAKEPERIPELIALSPPPTPIQRGGETSSPAGGPPLSLAQIQMAPGTAALPGGTPPPTSQKAEEPAAPPPVQPPPPPAAPTPDQSAAKPRSDWTFDTLLVGAYNRFAHAAATSVIASPGSMYNPLFLYGAPGTGKSHILHAVASGLSRGQGDSPLWLTTGPRLSMAARSAAAAKNAAPLERRAAASKALLVDDIHLMSVDETSRELLSRLFKSFFDRGLQVVLTSHYPPRALAALEDALKLSFSKGWSVDVKVPSPAVQKEMIAAVCERAGAGFTPEEVSLIHEKLSGWGYSDLSLWLRRLLVLKRAREAARQPSQAGDLLALIYDPLASPPGDPPGEEQMRAARFSAPTVGPSAVPLAVLTPKSREAAASWAASRLYETAARQGINPFFRHALWESYDDSVASGVPFVIGEVCARAKVRAVLLVGPGPESPLASRAAEFCHAVRRILESEDAALGWIPCAGLQTPAYFLNAALDLSPGP